MAESLRKRRRRFIQLLLLAGWVAAATLMLSGLVVWVVSDRPAAPAVTPDRLLSPINVSDRLMMTGILLLAIAPVLTVLALLLLWLRERAWRFAAIAGLVLILLALAFWLGGG